MLEGLGLLSGKGEVGPREYTGNVFFVSLLHASILELVIPNGSLLGALFLRNFFRDCERAFVVQLLMSSLDGCLDRYFLVVFFGGLVVFQG